MKTILITGGTGLLGARISDLLSDKGYKVQHLSRTENLTAKYPAYQWDLQAQTIDKRALEDVHGIIHLAGAGIADARWSQKRKQEIINSRVRSTQLLANCLVEQKNPPTVFVSCSAVGFYGSKGAATLTEEAPPGQDFMSDVCVQWEQAADAVRAQGIRTPIVRVGVVMSTQGGALEKINLSYGFRVGAYFSNGQQYMSWIHLDDICNIFIRALEDDNMDAIYNGTAPTPTTNKVLAKALSTARDQHTLLVPVPTFALRTAMGEMADVVLNSTRAVPKALIEMQYTFQFPELVGALEDLLQRKL
ncbi:MAG: TIGR01777 family oxidoreductase [Aureispira sp.]